MSTMVERVARAIELAGWKYARQQAVGNIPDMCEAMARAAIEAMMEPTDAMLDAVADEEDRRGIPNSVIDALIAEEAWPLMIQAALKEQA
ncbi:hypothetical protein RWA06_04635 [Sinorhizobium meliloti]|uniref:hypothetical protein n=1 Tax=Rhizobium meliloti TaxID=382 RepID=UPI00299DF991|nr:hypothetical protein [Sinorhizobium meliloti]